MLISGLLIFLKNRNIGADIFTASDDVLVKYYIVDSINNNSIHDIASVSDMAEISSFRFNSDKNSDYFLLRVKTSEKAHNDIYDGKLGIPITPLIDKTLEDDFLNSPISELDVSIQNDFSEKMSLVGKNITGTTVKEVYNNILNSDKWMPQIQQEQIISNSFNKFVKYILKEVFAHTTVATDNFNGNTENPLATNWSTSGIGVYTYGLKGYGNGAAASTGSQSHASYWDANSFDNDQYAQVKVVDNGGLGGVVLRYDVSKDNFYTAFVRDVNRVRLNDSDANILLTYTNTGTYTNGGTFKAEVSTYTITIYWNGVSQTSYTDLAQLADDGATGISCFGNSTSVTYLDDFEGGNLADPPAGGGKDNTIIMIYEE